MVSDYFYLPAEVHELYEHYREKHKLEDNPVTIRDFYQKMFNARGKNPYGNNVLNDWRFDIDAWNFDINDVFYDIGFSINDVSWECVQHTQLVLNYYFRFLCFQTVMKLLDHQVNEYYAFLETETYVDVMK